MSNRFQKYKKSQDFLSCLQNSTIDPSLHEKYDVKRGLRDLAGKGVLTGLTEISVLPMKLSTARNIL